VKGDSNICIVYKHNRLPINYEIYLKNVIKDVGLVHHNMADGSFEGCKL
jgi:hypothetical protein